MKGRTPKQAFIDGLGVRPNATIAGPHKPVSRSKRKEAAALEKRTSPAAI
jgi:hypothetical protein